MSLFTLPSGSVVNLELLTFARHRKVKGLSLTLPQDENGYSWLDVLELNFTNGSTLQIDSEDVKALQRVGLRIKIVQEDGGE